MYGVVRAKQFERSIRKLAKSGKLSAKLNNEINEAVAALAFGKQLPPSYADHALKGEWTGYRECHIRGDLLLVYKIVQDKLVLFLADIGTHAYLFGE
jgi:mRNA interferase YafQ